MTSAMLREVVCPDCGETRVIKSYAGREKLCMSCANKRSQRRQGHHPPRDVTCVTCGKVFVARGYRISPKFCSQACHGVAMREERDGEKNPNFRHGLRRGEHIQGWSVIDKGETRCRLCGSEEMIALHHIIPRGKWRAGRRDLRNGIPLCATHHSRWHRGHREITSDYFTDEEWSFVSSAELTGEVTAAWLERHYPTIS